MTRTEAKNALIKEFQDSFGYSYEVAYENNPDFEKPTDEPWVRFTVKNNVSVQRSFGKDGFRKYERNGIISYQVFIPTGTGTYDGEIVCDHINSIFEGKRFEAIYCESGYWTESGRDGTDWFQFNGRILFNFDEIK